jgi:hypothetical protein
MSRGRNNTKIFAALVAALVVLFLFSCQSNRWFQSESSLNAKIQNTWNKIRINPAAPIEQWKFSDGKVTRMEIYPDTTITDNGNYSIHTTLSKAYLTITDFILVNDELNAKWEILELDGGVLFIATDHDGRTGVKQLEFSEK